VRRPRAPGTTRPPPAPADAGGAAIAGIATGLGAGIGALAAVRLAYAYADAAQRGDLGVIAIIVFGGFGGAIVGGTLACWLGLRIGRRFAAGETTWRTLAFLMMLAPVLLFGNPALHLTPLTGLLLGVVAAGLAGVVARLLTPGRGSDAGPRHMP
jgi:hypothetical protein